MKQFHFVSVLLLSLLVTLVTGCKTEKEKQIELLISKIESTGIENYQNIEYLLNDSVENYSLWADNAIFTNWKYNRKTNSFEVTDSSKIKIFSKNIHVYLTTLRSKVQATGVVAITQGFKGYKQFWIADNEYVSYIYRNEYDANNSLLNEELKTADEVKSGWYFTHLKVCRNR